MSHFMSTIAVGRLERQPAAVERHALADRRHDGDLIFGATAIAKMDKARLVIGTAGHGQQATESFGFEASLIPDLAPDPGFGGKFGRLRGRNSLESCLGAGC